MSDRLGDFTGQVDQITDTVVTKKKIVIKKHVIDKETVH